jgi:hypothetical protein
MFISETCEWISIKDEIGEPTVASWHEGLILVFIIAI